MIIYKPYWKNIVLQYYCSGLFKNDSAFYFLKHLGNIKAIDKPINIPHFKKVMMNYLGTSIR